MEKVKAVFCKGEYFLLPKDADFNGFVNDLTDEKISLVQLCETNCMAPYFIYESKKEVSISFEKNDLFPVEVFLLSKDEYENRLRKTVEEYCHGCTRFGGDAIDLTGHHEEISLDSVCFERCEEGERFQSTGYMKYFWTVFSNSKEKIKNYIDKKNYKSLSELMENLFSYFMLPPRLFYKKADGKYNLHASCMNNELHWHFLNVLENLMPEELKTEFTFSASLKKDGMNYLAQTEFETPQDLAFKIEEENTYFKITAFSKKFSNPVEEGEHLTFLYFYLCEKIGENQLLFLRQIFSVSSVFETGCMTPKEAVVFLEQALTDRKQRVDNVGRIGPLREFETETSLPYKDKITVFSFLSEFSVGMFTDFQYVLDTCENYFITTGYLAFELSDQKDACNFLGAAAFPEYVKKEGVAQTYAQSIGSSYCIDMLVFDKKLFKKYLRDFAPLFLRFNAKWVECTPNGFEVWNLDFTPTVIKTVSQTGEIILKN